MPEQEFERRVRPTFTAGTDLTRAQNLSKELYQGQNRITAPSGIRGLAYGGVDSYLDDIRNGTEVLSRYSNKNGSACKLIQERLNIWLAANKLPKINVDGNIGTQMQAALDIFIKAHDITNSHTSPVVGKGVMAKLDAIDKQGKGQGINEALDPKLCENKSYLGLIENFKRGDYSAYKLYK